MRKIAILGLSLLAFAACKTNTAGTVTDAENSKDINVETVYDIAYIQMDSLVNNYNRFIDLNSAFETKLAKVQGDLETRARRLENEMIDLEEKANKGLMTRSDIAAAQQQIQSKGQSFENDRQTQMATLAEEEQVLTNQVMYAIREYVAKYNSDYRYKMILVSSGGTPVLHAEPALDITADILKGLNDEYAAEKPAAK